MLEEELNEHLGYGKHEKAKAGNSSNGKQSKTIKRLKDVLGLWVNETESSSFWSKALSDIRARGVEDIIIACSDNLKGLSAAIKAIFPQTITQLCIVHQIRNSMRYVPYKERKQFSKDLRTIYEGINIEQAEIAFIAFEQKWKENILMCVAPGKTTGKI